MPAWPSFSLDVSGAFQPRQRALPLRSMPVSYFY